MLAGPATTPRSIASYLMIAKGRGHAMDHENDYPPDGDELPGAPLMGLLWKLSCMSAAMQLAIVLRREGADARLDLRQAPPQRDLE